MEYDLNLREYWRIVRKRKVIVLFSALLMGIFSTGMAYMNKPVPVYEATATVKIEKNSTATGIYLEALSWSGADYLETQASIITSYPIMEKVAKELGLIDRDLDSATIRSDSELIGIILSLKSKVSTEREGSSNLINIVVQSKKRKEAQEIANTVARVYTVEHTNEVNKRTYDSRNFIEDQLRRVGEKLKEAEEKVKLFREKNALISLNNQTANLLSSLAKTEAEYLEKTKEKKDIEAMLDRIAGARENKVGTKDSFFITGAPPIYETLNSKLVSLLLERDADSLSYTDEHPRIKEIDSRIEEIVGSMQTLLRRMAAAADKRAGELKENIDGYQEKISLLPDKRLTLARLEREVELNEKVYAQLESKLQEANIMGAAKIEEVTVVKPALEPAAPAETPHIESKAAAGVVIGLIIGLVFAFIYETFDTSIGAIEEIEEFTGSKVLGTIPDIDLREFRENIRKHYRQKADIPENVLFRTLKMITHFMPNTTTAECYRAVRANVQFAGFEEHNKLIGFTSAVLGEGKSTTIINAAITMAQSHNKVLLVEADLRKPIVAKSFGTDSAPGLTDIILGSYEWRDIVQNINDLMLGEMDVDDVVLTPGLDNLHIIPCGTLHSNPAELLSSDALGRFFAEVKHEYDVVLIDMPPILSTADASLVCAKVDTAVLVYKAGSTARGALRRAKNQLEQAHVNILGIIINGLKADQSSDFSDLYNFRNMPYQHQGARVDKFSWASFNKKILQWRAKRRKLAPDSGGGAGWPKIAVVVLGFALLAAGVLWKWTL